MLPFSLIISLHTKTPSKTLIQLLGHSSYHIMIKHDETQTPDVVQSTGYVTAELIRSIERFHCIVLLIAPCSSARYSGYKHFIDRTS